MLSHFDVISKRILEKVVNDFIAKATKLAYNSQWQNIFYGLKCLVLSKG
jgi:hypothetical protein